MRSFFLDAPQVYTITIILVVTLVPPPIVPPLIAPPMANTYDYDLVTIGAGSGGTRASRLSAAVYKQRVAVIELPFNYVASDQTGGAGGTYVG